MTTLVALSTQGESILWSQNSIVHQKDAEIHGERASKALT